MTIRRIRGILWLSSVLVLSNGLDLSKGARAAPPAYRSPFDVVYSADGKLLAVSDRTAGLVAVVDPASAKVLRSIPLGSTPLKGEPTGLAWAPQGSTVYVSDYHNAAVVEIDAAAGRVVRRISVGAYPMGLAIAAKRNLLLVANDGTNDVSAIDLKKGTTRARIPVVRRPTFLAVSPDESKAVVANLIPADPATDSQIAASVTMIDLEKLKRVSDVRLPAGSTSVRGVAVSPDGRWAYAVHTLGRFSVPTTQLERGWVNTNAISIIDLASSQLYATLLLDNISEGAADPWGIALSENGATAWITISGARQIAKLDLAGLHDLLAGTLDKHPWLAREKKDSGGVESVWFKIHKNAQARADLVNDLSALYVAKLIDRVPLPVNGPRGLARAPDGKHVAIAGYYSGNILFVDTAKSKVVATATLAPAGEPDIVRRGEALFHDATLCFQHWLSCATCHPGEARVDGLNWDLPNDGLGNPKNTKSMLLAYKTPPMTARRVRPTMEVSVESGFRHILFREPQAGEVEAVQAYLRSLKPQQSPHRLSDGALSEQALRGKAVFENKKVGCTKCHPADLYTDMKSHNVATRGSLDRADDFDTPTLIELWRTAPYLHDGSAATLHDVISDRNGENKHGHTSHLTKQERDDLVEFLLSL